MICLNCGKEYHDHLEVCPFCEKKQQTEPGMDDGVDATETESSITEKPKENPSDFDVEKLSVEGDDESLPIENPIKKRNYDFVTKSNHRSQNIVLKALIVGMIMLILTVGVGTVSYIIGGIKNDSAERTAQLIEKGAVMGVSKSPGSSDIGSKYYVTGVTDSLYLLSEPSYDDSEELSLLSNGTVVVLIQKTSASFWKVMDVVSEKEGYVAPTFLTNNKDSIIVFFNEQAAKDLSLDLNKDKVKELCYVINAGEEGISVYNTNKMVAGSEIDTLTSGNTVGVIDDSEDIWRIYDYKVAQYGFMDSKYLTTNYDDVLAEKETINAAIEEAEESNDGKLGPEYYDSWSESGLSVRDGPTRETGTQVDRIEYGDIVQLIERTNEDFWYVYIPDLGIYGYVRSTCLTPVDENDTEPYENSSAKDAAKKEKE